MKITNIEKPKEMNVRSDSPSISSMSRPGANLTIVLPDKQRFPRNIKRKKIS